MTDTLIYIAFLRGFPFLKHLKGLDTFFSNHNNMSLNLENNYTISFMGQFRISVMRVVIIVLKIANYLEMNSHGFNCIIFSQKIFPKKAL